MKELPALSDDKIFIFVMNFLSRHRLTAFFTLTYLITFILELVLILAEKQYLPISIFYAAKKFYWLSILFGPSSVAIVLTAIIEGRKGIKELIKKILIWRTNVLWYIFILFAPAILYLCAIGLYVLAGGSSPDFINMIKWPFLVPLFFWVLLAGGPLNEELGWRGYALPLLQKKNSALGSSLIVGILWALWHLPLFWLPGAPQHGFPIPLFVLGLMAISVLMTWVYNNTNGSLLFPLLFHTSVNVATYIFIRMPKHSTGDFAPIISIYIGLLCLTTVAVIAIAGPHKLSRKSTFNISLNQDG